MNNELLEGLVNTPFVYGGDKPGIGLDCVGVVSVICQRKGISVQRMEYGRKVRLHVIREYLDEYFKRIPVVDRREGDVLLFRPGHLGVCSGNDLFIHAVQDTGVTESRLDEFWLDRLVGCWAL